MIKFIKITAEQYAGITPNENNFYLVGGTKLYLGSKELTTESAVITAMNLVNNESKGNEALYTEITKLEGDAGTSGSIANLLAAMKSTIEGEVVNSISAGNESIVIGGTATAPTAEVQISAKTGNNLSIETGSGEEGLYVNIPTGVDYTVTLSTDATASSVAKRYVLKQGPSGSQTTIGNIDIPKDMVVSEGTVVDITYDDGKLYDGATDVTEIIKGAGGTTTAADAGKYIRLTISNATTDKLYIAAKDLVDVYTAQQNATQVQLAIDSNNVISATIVADSIGTTELDDDAVTTAKILNANVTKAKLDSGVQTSLGKADSAIQEIVEGANNGEIKYTVNGTDYTAVSVHGLGSAAYVATTAFDAAGSAVAVQGTSGDASTAATVYGAKAYADEIGTAAASDATSKANAAEAAAKTYADGLISWETYTPAESI
jgi:hypothetical protein